MNYFILWSGAFGEQLCYGGVRELVGQRVRRSVLGLRPRVFKPNESKVTAAAARLYGPKSVSKTVESSLSYGGAATPAERKRESGVAIQPMNPSTARELRTRRSEL